MCLILHVFLFLSSFLLFLKKDLIMDNKETIASRLRFLRENHLLSVSQASNIFNKNKAAFSQIELGNIKPSYDFLVEIADFFAVSLDWLTGRTETPYVNEVIERQERFVFDLFKNITLNSNANLIYFKAVIFLHLGADYFEYCSGYNLEKRANVLYALSFWRYAANKLNEEGFNSQESPLHEVLKKKENDSNEDSFANPVTNFINYLAGKSSSKRAGTAFVQLCNQCLAILDEAKRQIPDMQFKITQAQMLEREKK